MIGDSSLNVLFEHAKSFRNLTSSEERDLSVVLHAGSAQDAKRARDKLVEHNMRLAIKLAREWVGCGLSFDDLVQEALVGLNVAVDGFDPDKGRLSTYATRWIKKTLWDAAYGSDTIKRPSRLARTVAATWDYLSTHAGASASEIAAAIRRPEAEVSMALDHGRVTASLDADFIEVGAAELEDATTALGQLEPAEREAVSWRYGLYGTPRALEEVARKMSTDGSLLGHYSPKDAARLCRAAVKKIRAARREEDDEVICMMEDAV
jgi:RNA polymerase primary sigma factor